jgi:peroxiredoxin
MVGDEAPNFDLSSTEDVVIMLRDEVPRTAVLLYLFADPADEATRGELAALGEAAPKLALLPVTVLGISPAKLPALKEAQRELSLPFPLLTDDRGFSAHYGVEAPEGEVPAPALVVVDRQQRVSWIANPAGSVREALGRLESDLKKLPSSTSNYPRTVINRLVDRWIN